MKIRAITAVLLFAAGLTLTAQSRPTPAGRSVAAARATPPLVVLIVVDQFRGDYVQWYGHQWTEGLRRLVDRGAYFPLAAYRYGVTLTCAGHATIGSGAFPRTHGMIANEWFDRDAKRRVACTDDPSVTPVGFAGAPVKEHHSARLLQANTFADELRNQAPVAPRITSVSLKPRSAIGMAGHAGDLVAWLEDTGVWASSSAFMKGPRPDVDAFAGAHAISKQYGRDLGSAAAAASVSVRRRRRRRAEAGQRHRDVPASADASWRPAGPAVCDQLGAHAVRRRDADGHGADLLGQLRAGRRHRRARRELLGARLRRPSLWAESHEVQDVLARLDVQLGRLFDALDTRLGPARYVVALSSDHGVSPIPEQVTAQGLDAGRYTAATVNARLAEAWKPFATDATNPIANGNGTDIYFTPAALAVLDTNMAARRAITEAALTLPGVARAYWADDLASGAVSTDPIREAMALSYYRGRSADLQLVSKAHWMLGTSAATHGTPYASTSACR